MSGRSLIAAAFGLIAFAVFTRVPLAHTDVWAHVAYGRWTVEKGIPATEPLLPSCAGVPMPPVDWLWNVTAYGLRCLPSGSANLVWLQAAPIGLLAGFLSLRMLRTSRSVVATLAGLAVAYLLLRHQLIIRPQLVGQAFFAIVLWLVRTKPRRWHAGLVAALFALWANVHGSWPLGLVAIGLEFVFSRRRRHWLLIGATAATAVCLNPAGPMIYESVLTVAGNPGIRDLIEWKPITATPSQFHTAIGVAISLVVLLLLSRRARLADLTLLLLTGAMMFDASRWIVWFGPVAALVTADQIGRLGRRFGRRSSLEGWPVTARRSLLAVVAVGTLSVLMSMPYQAQVSHWTPIGATQFLRKANVGGEIFCSQEFGDTLLWFGPADAVPHVHSHVHLIPEDVWTTYRNAIYGAENGRQLRRLVTPQRFAAVVLHRGRHTPAARVLLDTGRWRAAYADPLAVVLLPAETPSVRDR